MSTLGLYFRSIVLACMLVATASPLRASELTIVGTGDGLEVLQVLARIYGEKNPGLRVSIPPSIGSGGAIAAVGAGRERLGRVARALTANEVASGIVYRPILLIPSVFYVHRDVPVRKLSSAQLRAIFAGEITSWKELGGPDLRLRVVRREEADSSVLVFRASIPSFADLKFTERSKLALTTQDAITSVMENPGAIGFGPYSAELARQLGVISMDGHAPTDRGYPSNVTLALIYNRDRLDDDIRRFIAFLATRDAYRAIIETGARPAE